MKNKALVKLLRHISYAAIALSLPSCIGDVIDKTKDLNIESNLSLPLGSVSISDSTLLQSIGAENGIKIDESGILSYQTTQSVELSDKDIISNIIDFPTQLMEFNKTLPEVEGLNPGTMIPISELSPEGIDIQLKIKSSNRLEDIIFNGGYIDINIDNPDAYDYSSLTFTIKNITRNQQPITITDGQRIDFNDGANYELTSLTGNTIVMNLGGMIAYSRTLAGSIDLDITDITRIKGYFGRHLIASKSIAIKINEELSNFMNNIDEIYLSNPTISMEIDNQIDAPSILKLDTLKVQFTDNNGATIIKDIPTTPNAGMTYMNGIGKFTLTIDNDSFWPDSENLSDIISDKTLSHIEIITYLIINPGKEDIRGIAPDPIPSDQITNEIDVNNISSAEITINIPLEGIFKGLNMDYGLDMDLSSIDKDFINMNELAMGLWGKNNLPLDLSIMAQTRVGDIESGAATDLFEKPISFPASNGLLPSDPLFVPGVVIADDLRIATMYHDKAQKLIRSKKIFLKITGSSHGSDANSIVKICSPSDLDINIVMGAKADIAIEGSKNDPKE